MSEDGIAHTLWIVGAALVAAFVVLNFGVERIWFPRPHKTGPRGGVPVPPLVGPRRRGHMIMGAIEALFFIAGVICIAVGCSILGTRGYGSF